MRYKQIESAIIKISIVIACLIIGLGTVQRVLGTKAAPVATTKAVSSQNPAPTAKAGNGSAETDNAVPPQEIPQGKIVAIGDGYTSGGNYPKDKAWPNIVASDLNREVVNKGQTSQASADVLGRFQNDVINASPKVVIILVGAKDAMNGVSMDDYGKNIEQMVKLAKEKQITPVLGLPLPYPKQDVNDRITTYRGWLKKFAEQQSIWTIDFNQDLTDNGVQRKELFNPEGTAVNGDGYKAMARTIEKVLGK